MKRQSRRRRSHILSNQGWEKVKDAIWQRLKKCPDEYNFTELSEQTTLPESKPLDPETVSKILRREEGADLRSIKRLFGAFGQELEKSDYTCPPQSNSETCHLNQAIPAPLGKLSNVPNLPLNFLPRPDELKAIKTAVLVSTNQSVAVTGTAHRVGVQGMGGIGKSVLTAAIARDEEVRRAFPDGVLWVTLGQTPMLTSWQSHLAEVLGAGQRTLTDVQLGKALLGELLADKACLLILDDVWHTKHAAAFDALGQRCKMLLTTRDMGLITVLGAVKRPLPVLSNEQALALLAVCAGQHEETLPTEAHEVVRECGNLPLALAMIGAMVRDKPDRWANVLHKLRNADLEKIRIPHQFLDYPYSDLLKAIQVSVEALPPDVQRRYLDFAVFPEDTPIPDAALQTFWEPEGLDKHETQDVVYLLVERSLARRNNKGCLSLHDLQYDYVRKQASDLSTLHNRLLNAYATHCPNGWHTGTNDGYFFEHLAYHLVAGGQKEELRKLLFNFDWLQAKLDTTNVTALIADYELLPNEAHLRLVQGAMRLSAHVLAKDKTQLAGQLLGRLLSYEVPIIQALLEQAKQWKAVPWLRPLSPSLTPPNGSLLRTLCGSIGFVGAVAMTLDGRRAIAIIDTSHFSSTFKVWDLESGAELLTFSGHTQIALTVAVTPDGRRAISGSHDCTLKVWDLESGAELRTLEGHTKSVLKVAVTPDGRRAISGSHDCTLKVWDLENGTELHTLQGDAGSIWAITVTPDGHRVISSAGSWNDSSSNTIKVWDLESRAVLHTLQGHTKQINAVVVTPDGRRAVSGSSDCTLKVWDLERGTELFTLFGHDSSIHELAVTGNGQYAISAANQVLKVWDLDRRRELRTLYGFDYIMAVKAMPDKWRAISALGNGTVKVWDIKIGEESSIPSSHSNGFTTVAVSSTSQQRRAISRSEHDYAVKVWNLDDGRELHTLRGHTSWFTAAVITPDGKRAVSAAGWRHSSSENTLKVWDLERGTELHTLRGHSQYVSALEILPDGLSAISASKDCTLKVWDLETGVELFTLQGHTDPIVRMTITPNGRYAISISTNSKSNNNMLKVWDLENRSELYTLHNLGYVLALAITPDSQRFILDPMDNSARGILKVFDLESGKELRTLRGHSMQVTSVTVTPDGLRAVSSSMHKTLKVWDLQSGRQLHTLRGHTSGVGKVALTTDGRYALSTSSDCTLKIWDLERGKLVTSFTGEDCLTCCTVAPDNVTIVASEASGRVHFLYLEGA
jgi:WD40 repeat protein